MNFALSHLDIAIIIGSLLAVVGVGLWAGRNQEKTARGYFLASGKLPWYIIGAAFVSTSVSSEQIVGTVGATYKYGMGIANWEWWLVPVYGLLTVVFVPMWLRNRVTTVPEFLTKRFGSLCGDIYSWVMLVAYVFVFLVPVLYSGSLALSDLTRWNFHVVLWGTVLLVALYTTKGGLASVIWSDALQCVMLVGGGVILFFVALDKVPGGWAAMEAANPERFHLYRPPSDPAAPFLGILLATFGVFIFYSAGNQVMAQRILGARSTWDGQIGVLWAGVINLLRPLVTCFIGLIVFHWINVMHAAPALQNPDEAFPFALRHLAPDWGLRGIILAGFLAAVMSTISALANSTATIFSLDVYKQKINPAADDARLVRMGRIASLASLSIAALVAPSVAHLGGVFKYFQNGVTYLATPFISVMLLGLLWKRANRQGALFGLIGGSVITLVLAIGAPALGVTLHWLYLGAIAQAITMLGMVIVSLYTPPPPEEQWKPFHWTLSALKEYDDGVRRPWYQSVLLWWSIYIVGWVYLYWRFW
ncbi:MAG: sodium/solute symporter [Luteolibacter sp.]|jgi:SSS family solute:Na+ symporter|nr:sodium/solute symporter [Luteolibacter sp.]